MKKIYSLLTTVLIATGIFAQSPEKMSYQAVVRDATDALVTSTTVGMQISILQSTPTGTAVYVETQTPTTNTNGLVTIEIGSGILVSGDFTTIDWSAGPYFIKTETDPTGGTTYTITGTSQLLSVPYALHAKTAETVTETDPVFGASDASGITSTDITNWDNKLDTEVDGSTTNEIQTLSITGNDLTISGGNTVALPTEGKTDIISNALEDYSSSANLIRNHNFAWGVLQLRATVAGSKTIYVHIDVPSKINNIPQKLESVKVLYRADNPLSYITGTVVSFVSSTGGGPSTAISNATDRTSGSFTTYTVTDLSPNLVTGSVLIRFDLQFGGTGVTHDIEITTITVSLTN